jgi:hypothetical protein
LITYSEDFTDASWAKFDVTVSADATTSPSGSSNADKIVEGTGSSIHRVNTAGTIVSGTSYTVSAFFKAAERTRVLVRTNNGSTDEDTYFDLSSGTVISGSGLISDLGNGWFRVSRTFTAAASVTSSFITQFLLVSSGTTTSYTGDGTSGVYIYGAQLEEGSTPSSYTPTNGSTATRAAETLTIPAANLPWPTPRVIGDELVTNGTFDTDSDWTKGTGWTISGVATATSATSGLYQALSLVAGNTYRVTYTVSGFSAGSVRPRFIGGTVASGAPVAANGTHTDYLVATSGTLGLDITGSIFTGTIDNISVTEIDPLAVSIQMEGRMNYADTVASTDAQFLLWQADSNNKINNYLISNGATTGQIVFLQRDAGTSDFTASPADTYSPGINVPFNIASRHGSTFINGAVDGTALTADTTPVALPDLSATDLELGYDFMGTIKTFRIWADDIGDAGLEASTT